MATKLLHDMRLEDIAGDAEHCTCECPDGKDAHLENCHIYDNCDVANWRRSLSRTIRNANGNLMLYVSDEQRIIMLDFIRCAIYQAHKLGHAESKIASFHQNTSLYG